MKNSQDFKCKIAKKDVALFCAYLGAFEGVCALRNPDPKANKEVSIISIMVSPSFQKEFNKIIAEISKELDIYECLPAA